MHIIRTAEALARALATPDLNTLLQAQADRLEEYHDFAFEDLAEILIVEADDTLAAVEQAYGRPLVEKGTFVFPVEWITHHAHWYEVGWILSDDGFGLVLFVAKANAQFAPACEQALEA